MVQFQLNPDKKQMDSIKIRNFQHAYSNGAFPSYKELSSDECASIRRQLAETFGISTNTLPVDLVNKIQSMSRPLAEADANDTHFDLAQTLQTKQIPSPKLVFVNWNRFDRIDQMRFQDLRLHFDSIWYPSSDDIDIFDETCEWVLSVAHYGSVSLAIQAVRK